MWVSILYNPIGSYGNSFGPPSIVSSQKKSGNKSLLGGMGTERLGTQQQAAACVFRQDHLQIGPPTKAVINGENQSPLIINPLFKPMLLGGFKCFLFSTLLGEDSDFD